MSHYAYISERYLDIYFLPPNVQFCSSKNFLYPTKLKTYSRYIIKELHLIFLICNLYLFLCSSLNRKTKCSMSNIRGKCVFIISSYIKKDLN